MLGDTSNIEYCDSVSHNTNTDSNGGISTSLKQKFGSHRTVKATIAEFILELYNDIDQSLECDVLFAKKTVREKFAVFIATKKCRSFVPRCDIGTLLRQFKFLKDTPRGSNYYSIPIQNVLQFYKNYLEENLGNLKNSNIKIESSTESLDVYKTENNESSSSSENVCATQIEKSEVVKFVSKLYEDLKIGQDGNILKVTVRKEFSKFLQENNYDVNTITQHIGTLLRECKLLKDTPRGSANYCIPIQNVLDFHKENLLKLNELQASEFSMINVEAIDKQIESLNESLKTIIINETKKIEPDLLSKNTNKFPIETSEISKFILKLYHDLHLESNGNVLKSTVRNEFSDFLKANNYNEKLVTKDIGTILREAGCLWNTPKGSPNYQISLRKMFEFRNETLKNLDEMRIKNKSEHKIVEIYNNDKPLEAFIEVSPNAEEFPLVFQGGCQQNVVANFKLSNLGCYICQKNFESQLSFEDHVSTHGFESDFEYLSSLKRMENIFEINYRLCNKSHYFYFTMKTKSKEVIIEKIIIIQTRLMQFVKNNIVPYKIASDGLDSFLIDSHLFTIGVEQPVVVVYRYSFDKTTRYMEQHHFLRIEEFPQVHFKIRSTRLSSKLQMKMKLKLDEYFPDGKLKLSQVANFSDESLMNVSDNFRHYLSEHDLHQNNICDVFRTEVQIEDLESSKDYYPLQQKSAAIKRFGKEYSVRLKKLPKHIFLENIVTPLDEICLTVSNLDNQPKNSNQRRRNKEQQFVAIIERVYYDTVCFKYDKGIIDQFQLYDIVLRPSRLSLKYQYRALEMLSFSSTMKNYLFPIEMDANNEKQKCLSLQKLELFNESLQNNAEQLQAVLNIAYGNNYSAPYIIFGPPGTGKTTTIVEAILQLWKNHPNTSILITAGSNAACDEVAIRLVRVISELQTENLDILRIFAKSNEKRLDSIEDILLEASNFYGEHFYPSIESIRMYRIIVCTQSIVGKLVSANIGVNFFTHIFIDECAASTEPEALVALMGTSSLKTRLILSGDHKQLGAVLKSQRAADLGLKISLMERLLNRQCYEVDDNGDYDRSIQTRLIQNYRSHPEIVRLFNTLYYNNELKPLANMDQFKWATQWHMLPNRNYPIIFHSVYGNSMKINNSVSLSNVQELNAVMDYVKDLLYFGMKDRKIDESDIGIISPYKKQYTLIKEQLGRRQWHRIEVGSVETFQGKEKAIIIVSTVRSNTKSLGFLDNPNRLNVILSRPIALLIIIGNPKTLSQNDDFKFIIEECKRNNCVIGGGFSGGKTFIEDTTVGTPRTLLTPSVSQNNLNKEQTTKTTNNKKPKLKSAIKRTSKKTGTGKNVLDINLNGVRNLCSDDLKSSKQEDKSTNNTSSSLPMKNINISESKVEKIGSTNTNYQHTSSTLNSLPNWSPAGIKNIHPVVAANSIIPQQPKPRATVIPSLKLPERERIIENKIPTRIHQQEYFVNPRSNTNPTHLVTTVKVPQRDRIIENKIPTRIHQQEYVVNPNQIQRESTSYHPHYEINGYNNYPIILEDKKPKKSTCVIA